MCFQLVYFMVGRKEGTKEGGSDGGRKGWSAEKRNDEQMKGKIEDKMEKRKKM